MRNLTEVLDDKAAQDAKDGVTRRQKLLQRVVAPLLTIAVLGVSADSVIEAGSDSKPHSVEYLSTYPQVMNVLVNPGDTPNSIANAVNKDGLSGQTRADELQYIGQEGVGTATDGSPMLIEGQHVNVPVIPTQDK